MNAPRLIVFVLTAAVLAAPGTAPASLVDGIVVHYTFDDQSDLGADALGNHPGALNAGTTGVPTYSTGSQGVGTTASHVTGAGAISFEGVNGYVSVADWTDSPLDTATGPGQARTVSFWFQSVTSATEVILEKGTNLHFVTHYEPLRWRVTSSGGSVNVLDPEALRDGNWHHYAGVHAGGVNYLYIDGVYQGETVSPVAPTADNNPFVMGARVGPQFPFEGKLDDVAIWNRQLSPAEVNLLVRAGRLGFDVSEAAELQVPGVTYQYGTASTSQPHATYPDIGGTQLTDGYRLSNHTSSFTDPAWVGFRDDARSLLTPHPEITFDLHGSYLLDEIWILYLGGNYAGIMSPDFVLVSFSDDGQTFSDPLAFTPFSEPGEYSESNLAVEEAVIKLGGRTASHVRLEFRNEAQWTFLGEVAFVAVPEPNSVLLLAVGGLWLLAGRRNRRRGQRAAQTFQFQKGVSWFPVPTSLARRQSMNLLRISVILLAAAALATPTAAQAQYLVGGVETHLGDGMVVHYTFDDALNLAADALGNHPGTLNAGTTGVPAHSTGLQGLGSTATHVTGAGGISFEGVNGYVQVADWTDSPLDTATGPGQARTVAFWFQTTAAANLVVMEKGTNLHFVAQTGSNGKPFWRVGTGGNAFSLASAQDGTWHHFVGTHADGVNYLYIDGVYQGQATSTVTPPPDNNALVMGARPVGQFPYEGKLDDVAIWSRELTPAEIRLVFTAGKLGLDAGQAAAIPLPFQIMNVTYEYGEASTSKPSSTYPDIGGTQLTDFYSTLNHTNSFTHPAWVGFRDEWNNPENPHPEITFDLQRRYNLDEIRVIYMGGNHAGIQPPDSLWVSFSDDGLAFSDPTMYTPFSATPPVADPDSLTVEEALVEIGGEWARYVRLEFRNSAQWTFLGDVAFVAVPEPNTLLLLVMGGVPVLVRRRRRDAAR